MSNDKTVVLISGATGVIGYAIANELAATPDYEVVLLARDRDRAEKTADVIRHATGNDNVRFVLADVSRRHSVQAAARDWQGPLHVLVNNAGVAPRRRETTPEGIELTWATNVLAYLWVTEAFARRLAKSAPARVVNVASHYAGDLDLGDLEFKRRRFDNKTAYRQSKQANRMLTVAQAEELEGSGITVNACHPGNPSSVLSRSLGFGGAESPEGSARTPVMLALGELGADVTGRFFAYGAEVPCEFSKDRDAIRRLYEICKQYD
jgi:retinol dehydrogenase-12